MAHIVHVVESFGAGTLSMVSAMANRQVADGHRVTVLHSVREETPVNWRALFREQIHCIQVPMQRAIHPVNDLRAARVLHRWLKELQPDVVHLHSSKAGAVGRLVRVAYAGRNGPRWFFSPHGLSFLQKAEGRLKNGIFLAIEKLLTAVPVTFIACSPSEGEAIRQHLTQRVVVVDNAVDLALIPQAASQGERLRVGTVGRVTMARNPEFFAEVAQRCRDLPVDFVWIGGGDESGEAALKAAGVQVLGWLDRQAALAELAKLDIYIQTSRWEGLPVAVIEAMAAGLPVVATNVIGNKDLVRNDFNGYLAETPALFGEHIAALVQDTALRQRLGQAAQGFARENYSLDRMMAALYAAYGI